jgi:hypothetical protein
MGVISDAEKESRSSKNGLHNLIDRQPFYFKRFFKYPSETYLIKITLPNDKFKMIDFSEKDTVL